MSKWKCEICDSEFENFQAQGFDHKIYCPLCYFKELYRKTELERERLNNIIDEIDKIIRQMIYTGYYVYPKSPYEDFEGQTVTNYMATGESSEFGRRALVILDKLKALKEDKEWKRK